MDQIYQLQQQIQRMRQELNDIVQMTNQLQQFEQSNAAQLSRLQQHESNATQQLQRILQVCNQVNQDLNQVNGLTQQIASRITARQGMQYSYSPQPGTQMGWGQQTAQYTQPTSNTTYNQFGAGYNIQQQYTPYTQSGYFSTAMATNPGNITSGYYSPVYGQNFRQEQQNLQNPEQYRQNQFISQQANQALQQRYQATAVTNPGNITSGYYSPAYGQNFRQEQQNLQDAEQYQQNHFISQQANQALQQRYQAVTDYDIC